MVLLVKFLTIVLLIVCVLAEKKSPDTLYLRCTNNTRPPITHMDNISTIFWRIASAIGNHPEETIDLLKVIDKLEVATLVLIGTECISDVNTTICDHSHERTLLNKISDQLKIYNNCYITERNGKVIYTGNVNRTDNGLPCGRWDRIGLKYPLGPEHVNYCRNPDHDPKGLWCYLQWNSGWRYCNIPRCDIIPHLVPPPQQPRHTPVDQGARPGQPPTRKETTTSDTVESEIITREIQMVNIKRGESSSGGSASGGTVAGIIIGCIAVIAVVGLLVLFVHKRQIRPQRRLRYQNPTIKVSSSTIQRPDQEQRTGTAIKLNEFNGDAVYAQVNKRNKPSNKKDVITNRSSVVSAEYSHTAFMVSPENSTTSQNYGALHFDVTDGMYDVANKKCVRNSEIDQNYDHFVKPVKGKSSNYVNTERFSKWVNEDTTDYPETLDSDIYQNI